jgi:hypothetical protein
VNAPNEGGKNKNNDWCVYNGAGLLAGDNCSILAAPQSSKYPISTGKGMMAPDMKERHWKVM